MSSRDASAKLCQKVRDRLRVEPGVAGHPVAVEAQHDVVLLGGTVASAAAREAASRAARGVAGVRDVCNMITVSTDVPASGTAAPTSAVTPNSGRDSLAFETITANLLHEEPSLARRGMLLQYPAAVRIVLAVLASVVWAGWSIAMVIVGLPLVLLTCAVASLAGYLVFRRHRRPGE